MNTHDVAKALTHLARVLRAGPNVPLEGVGNLNVHAAPSPSTRPTRSRSLADKAAGLALLSQLSQISKPELIQLIGQLRLDVDVKKTDSVRDLLGRTLKYIAENPDVTERLASTSARESASPSPLMDALSILIGHR